MEVTELEIRLKKLTENINKESFIYDLLLAYDFPKATISRLKTGDLNLSKDSDEIHLKNKILFKQITNQDPHNLIDELSKRADVKKNNTRFVIVSNLENFLAVDTKTKDSLDISIREISRYFDFFLPWIGREKRNIQNIENDVNIKAATKIGRLYEIILNDNPTIRDTKEGKHALNVFLSRLLFCFFAEDSGIFDKASFTSLVANYTDEDASNLTETLSALFNALGSQDRKNLPKYINSFPYVNGNLFNSYYFLPSLSRKSRNIIIESGDLDWSNIHPDIFGSMVQSVASPEDREENGVHYTDVENILKVINPLFLDDLKFEFNSANGNLKKLELLLLRLENIKVFDPACGSGNFLIVAYKEIRYLEIEVLKEISSLSKNKSLRFSNISLSQFYGIEIDDFCHEIAILSLWLTEHQVNLQFKKIFGSCKPALPLTKGGNIICDNSTRVNWADFCTDNENLEIYILGNPPYRGAMKQDDNQTADLKFVMGKNYKAVDYIFAWFFKAAAFISNKKAKFAFVTTNSISQGEQVGIAWPLIFKAPLEIFFCHTAFKWSNNAVNKAAVSVVIVGLRNISKGPKFIYSDKYKNRVENISPLLSNSDTMIVKSNTKPLFTSQEMNFGNMPADGGNLLLSDHEKNALLSNHPEADIFIKKLISAKEFLSGESRWCFWLLDFTLEDLKKNKYIFDRIKKNEALRLKSSRPKLAKIPHLFAQITQQLEKDFILIPNHTSENREYIPIGFFDKNNISHNSCLIVSTNDLTIFAQLTSKMHMIWMRAFGGRIKTDYRYSSQVVYNTFPFLDLNINQKKILISLSSNILDIREKYTEFSIGDLYNPRKMPKDLLDAHHKLDAAIEFIYSTKPFTSDEERLKHIFNLYEKKINNA